MRIRRADATARPVLIPHNAWSLLPSTLASLPSMESAVAPLVRSKHLLAAINFFFLGAFGIDRYRRRRRYHQ